MVVVLLCFAGVSFGADAGTKVIGEGMRIGGIETFGNRSIGRPKIITEVSSKVGEIFNPESAAADCERIGSIEGVHTAYYNKKIVEGQLLLTYVVVEKRLIRSIAIKGNREIKTSKLLNELIFRKGDYLDISSATNGVTVIEDFYKKKGYYFAQVKVNEEELRGSDLFKVEISEKELIQLSLTEEDQSGARVEYTIDEGDRCRVKKVDFSGNDSISAKRLRRVSKTKPRKFVFIRNFFDATQLEADIESLQEAYRKLGYLNVDVSGAVVFSENKKDAFVTFTIDEGPVFYVSDVTITGSSFIGNDELLEDLKLQPGIAYGGEKATIDVRTILRRYREEGFVDVRVADVDDNKKFVPDDKVAVEFAVTPGDRFKVGRISVSGNKEVHDKVVRSILDEEGFVPGMWYNAEIAQGSGQGELEKTVQRLVMAESATIESVGDEPGIRNAQVNIVESKTGSVMFGAGVASNTGLMGQLTLDQRNFDIHDWPESWKELVRGKAFKGAGQRFRASANPGIEQSSYSVSFSDSYVYDKPISFDITGSGFEREQESWDETRNKAYVGFEKRYENRWRRGFSFRAEQVEVDDLERDAPKELVAVKGDTNLFGMKFFIRKDTTDSRFLPSKGYNFNIGYEQVMGDFTFGSLSATQRWYKTLSEDLAGRKTVLETKIHGSTILGDAPPFEKFYAGGSGSIRGFKYRGVSTRGAPVGSSNDEDGDPVGSDWLLFGSAEVSVPLETEVLSWLFFVDSGLIDTGGARVSVGTGIQILLPQWFGPVPMRFELAQPIMKDGSDEIKAFSFSVGALF
jgi:outer membrane protein insertion porin family